MKFSIVTFVTDRGVTPGRLGTAVEERGFHSLIVGERSHMPVVAARPHRKAGPLPPDLYRTLDPFVALASAAATTRTLTLTAGEQVQALRRIWACDIAEFHGKFVEFDALASWPEPVQQPRTPIYIGGASRAALKRVRLLGDGWLPLGGISPDRVVRARRWLADHGRPDVPTTICGAASDKKTLAAYAQAGVDQVALPLHPAPEAVTLRRLDELAAVAESIEGGQGTGNRESPGPHHP